jgi:septal ring factor EnvC (AmiA/AmiB activator)
MSQDEFTKLFKYMENRFNSIDQKLDTKASQDSVDRLTNTIDSFVKRLDNAEIEQASRDLQFDRLLEWAREVSKKTGVPLRNL